MALGIVDQETAKYAKIWRQPNYGDHSPGENILDLFLEISGCEAQHSVIDIGCGNAKAARKLAARGVRVDLLDLTDAQIPDDVREAHRLMIGPVWGPWSSAGPQGYDFGYCCDVMEHLPKEYTMLAIHRILEECRNAFFQIAFAPDQFGKTIGEPLHLTVEGFTWWRDRLNEAGHLAEARDFVACGVFYVSR